MLRHLSSDKVIGCVAVLVRIVEKPQKAVLQFFRVQGLGLGSSDCLC